MLNEGYCTGKIVPKEEKCSFESSTLLLMCLISLAEPAGLIASIYLMDKVGRRPVFICSGILKIILPFALYICVGRAYLVI